MIKTLSSQLLSFLPPEVRGREKAAASPTALSSPEKSALGEGWGAWGEGNPLPREARGVPSPQPTVHTAPLLPARAPDAEVTVHIVCCPLPATDSACRELTVMLSAELSPLLSSAQRAHLAAFRRTRAACSRWLSRLALAACLTGAGADPGIWLPQLQRRSNGLPCLPGGAVSFSHSEQAAFAALLPAAGENACLGLDAESLSSPPPAETALAPAGRGRGVPLPAAEALRCWTLKESLAKAAGTGLDCPPDRIPCGRHGQRRGALYWRERTFFWRTLPVPGHWLALTGTRPLRPIFRIIPTACLGRPHASRDLR